MNNIKLNLKIELIFLFVFIPFILLLEINIAFKIGSVLFGVIYVLITVIKNKLIPARALYSLPTKSFWKSVILKFLLLIIITTILMYISDNDKLFIVIRKNITLWLIVSLFYSVVSVFPQEFLYRSFFFNRYGILFNNHYILITLNAIVFSLAHVGFKNLLVLFITLIGGFIFAITYFKTKSLLFTSIEHALYGTWLFTIGMGEMLAFPMPE